MESTRSPSPGRQMRLLLATSIACLAVALAIAWVVIDNLKGSGDTFRRMSAGKDLLADVLPPPASLLQLHDELQSLLLEGDAAGPRPSTERLRADIGSYEQQHRFWAHSDLPRAILQQEGEAFARGQAFVELMMGGILPELASGDRERALRLFRDSAEPAFRAHQAAVDRLVREVRAYNAQIAEHAAQQERRGKLLLAGFGAAVLVLIAAWGMLLLRRMEEQRAEEARQRADEERYRFALEAAGVGAWEWDTCTNQVRWSDAVSAMFGLAPSEFAGTFPAYLELLTPEERPQVESAIRAALLGTVPSYQVEHRVILKDGSVRWLEGKGRVGLDAQPPIMRGIVADVTARKQLEAERRELEDKLRHAQRMEAVGRLAGGVAHDFNNILTGIIGFAELARLDLSDHAALAQIEGIHKAAKRAGVLTRQLLAFSRKQVLEPEHLDVAEVLGDLVGMLERLLGSQLRLEVECAPGTPTIKADRGQLEQVVVNLVVNARDAMPAGGTIKVKLAVVDHADVLAQWGTLKRSGKVVVLSVSDQGSGIPEELRTQLFQPYFTTKPEGKGTGLGLSTVYGIVQQSGGAIGLRSSASQGTTFDIYLPAEEAPKALGEPVRAPLRTESAVRRESAAARTILVAEDDPAIARVLGYGLKRLKFEVLLASDGDSALELLRQNRQRIGVLLTDLVMPGKSGKELAEEARSIEPSIEIIFMSGYAPEEAMHETLQRLDAGLLHKPFTQEELAEKIAEALIVRPRSSGSRVTSRILDLEPTATEGASRALP